MRIAPFALAITVLSLTPILRGETLGAVLTANKLPPDLISKDERQQPITSFAVSAEDSRFLIAYYDDDGSGTLPPLLHILRYDQQTGDLRRTDLHGIEIPFQIRHEVMTQVSSTCMGSALNISEKGGHIVIDTHISPSAGCVLILTSDLSFVAGLWGWALAVIDGNIIFEENTIHFAPTHPARISAYNLPQKKLTPIYPSETDPARKQFSAELQNHLASSKWCGEQNNPCDPETFSTDIDQVTVNENERSFAFDAQMTPEGFGEDAERSIKPKTIHYTCSLKDGKWFLTPGINLGLHDTRWEVRRDAYECLMALPEAPLLPPVQESLIKLRQLENIASNKSMPDLFEDDDYLAYDEQLTKSVQEIAVQTNNHLAWKSLVEMRYNGDSETGKWLASHRQSLAPLEQLLRSPHSVRRENAVYVIALLLKYNHGKSWPSPAKYRQLVQQIRSHITKDEPGVPNSAIEGLGLIDDPRDVPFLEAFIKTTDNETLKSLAAKTIVAIRNDHPRS